MPFKQRTSGDLIPFTLSGTLSAGDVVVLNDMVGICANDGVSGDQGYLAVEGTFGPITCLGTDVIGVGDDLWWDAGNSRLTLTASTHKYAGKAASVSGSGTTTVDLKLVQAPQS